MLQFDLMSAVRHVLVAAVALGAVRLSNDQVEVLAPAIGSVLMIAFAIFWSRRDRKVLLHTPPPPRAPLGDHTGRIYSSSRIGPPPGSTPAVLLVLTAFLVACAPNKGTVGMSVQTGVAEARNAAPASLSVEDSAGEKLWANGAGPSGYILTDIDQSRWLYNGATPVNTFIRRQPDGTLAFNMGSGKDTVIKAAELTIDPATGAVKAKGLELSSNASEPIRAGNEAYDRLVDLWKSWSTDQRAVFIATLEAQSKSVEASAPIIAQGLNAVIAALKGTP